MCVPRYKHFATYVFHFISDSSTINKNPETDIGAQSKVRKAKQPVTGSYLYLCWKQWYCLQESQNETESDLSYGPL